MQPTLTLMFSLDATSAFLPMTLLLLTLKRANQDAMAELNIKCEAALISFVTKFMETWVFRD